MLFKNRNEFKKMLKEVQEHPMRKGATNQHFSKDQWIQYDIDIKEFVFSDDGIKLGKEPKDVVSIFRRMKREGFCKWIDDADWYIKDL